MLVEELLKYSELFEKPPLWGEAIGRLAQDRRAVDNLLSHPTMRIYGFNTLTGHRDKDILTTTNIKKINEEIIFSHSIGTEPYFSAEAARCIGYAKLYALAAGGSGISTALFKKLADVVSDRRFSPLIPRNASYSSGDVIPASHWAKAAIAHAGKQPAALLPGEAMALVNGRFVQVGATIAAFRPLRRLWCMLFEATLLLFSFPGLRNDSLRAFHTVERVRVSMALEILIEKLSFVKNDRFSYNDQVSVSVRSFPQVIESLYCSVFDILSEINYVIFKPSSNPYFQSVNPNYVSQASFLAPILTSKISSVIDAVLFAGTMVLGRFNFLISGEVAGIPIDGAKDGKLGLIQVPKLMAARLEMLRSRLSGRLAAQHVSMSYGREDLASYGLIALEQLSEAIDGVTELVKFELAAMIWLAQAHGIWLGPQSKYQIFNESTFYNLVNDVDKLGELDSRDSWSAEFFPIRCE